MTARRDDLRRSRTLTARRTVVATVAAGLVATSLTACSVAQDVFQVGEREFRYDTAAAATESRETFRFQGFLPDDATDVRLLAELDGHAAVMRWTSPTPFESEHCTSTTDVGSAPGLEPDWLMQPMPSDGHVCGLWAVVRHGEVQVAWTNEGLDD